MKTISILPLLVAATLVASPTRSHIVIAAASEPGARLVISGRVLDANGRGMPNVIIHAYHTDARGLYRADNQMYSDTLPPRLQGYLRTAADGSYEIETIRPAPYPNRSAPAHVHFELREPDGHRDYAILWFAGDPLLAPRDAAAHPHSVCTLTRTSDGVLHCTRNFYVGKEGE
jgi:protocatechuate 3,4-dioxygenase beta subunit